MREGGQSAAADPASSAGAAAGCLVPAASLSAARQRAVLGRGWACEPGPTAPARSCPRRRRRPHGHSAASGVAVGRPKQPEATLRRAAAGLDQCAESLFVMLCEPLGRVLTKRHWYVIFSPLLQRKRLSNQPSTLNAASSRFLHGRVHRSIPMASVPHTARTRGS